MCRKSGIVLRLAVTLALLAGALALTGCFGGGGGISVYGSIDGYVYYHADARGTGDSGAAKPEMIVTRSSKAPSGYLPLQGAKVVAVQAGKVTYSNSRGYFILTSLNPGVYTVSITHERFIMGLTYNNVPVVAGRTTTLSDAKLGSFFYLIIGIDDYPDGIPDLTYCVEDAQAMADVLYAANGYAGEIEMLTNAAANKEGIRAAIERIGDKMSTEGQDYFVMTFSGHGGSTTDLEEPPLPNPPDVDPPDEFLVASDGELIYDDELTGWIQQYIRNKTDYCLFVFDSCRSGGMTKIAQAASSSSAPAWMKNFRPGLSGLARDLNQYGYVVLMACNDTEYSWEWPELKHGVFTYFFCESIKGPHYPADADGNGLVSAREVFDYASWRVSDYVEREIQPTHPDAVQTPQIFAEPSARAEIPIYRVP